MHRQILPNWQVCGGNNGRLIAKYENPKILLLGRYGFDGYNLTKSADFIYDDKTGSVRSKKYNADYFDFMTVHRAKGLGYDHVIIINARNETYGFPSQVQEYPVLKYVVKDDHSQQVDGLKTSEYLFDTARKHIEGDLPSRKQQYAVGRAK